MKMINFSIEVRFFLAMITAVAILIVLAWVLRNRHVKQAKAEGVIVSDILNSVLVEKTLKENLVRLLHIFGKVVTNCTSYGFYLYDTKSGTYLLKSVVQTLKEEENIEPSYSGLLPYSKEVYFMPPSLGEESMSERISIRAVGKVPLIHVPLPDINAIVVIGPQAKLSKKTLHLLKAITPQIQSVGRIMIWNEEQGNKAVVAVSSDRALKNISRIFTDYERMLGRVMNLTAKSIHASECFFINRRGDDFSVDANSNMRDEIYAEIREDESLHRTLYDLLGGNKSLLITQGSPHFYRLSPYLAADGVEALILVEVDTVKGNGIAVFLYKRQPAIEEYQITALHILSDHMSELVDNQLRFKELSYSYNDMLKMLAQIVDSISPATVGYSEQMWGYAVIIAKELGLEPERIRAIAMAAYFSNIGIVGLSDDLLGEKGKYTEIQYEMMKLHVEVGASIIESTLGDDEIASYIRYHHEREDGFGYPEGLAGGEVPMGARIIGVIQTFLAKLQSREYRTSLPFDQALQQLRQTAGTQHDETVIEALVSWFERKRTEQADSGMSLGRCWEMRRCPEQICINCPAYRNVEINCWKNEGVLCEAHGNECKSCFVYTEFAQRTLLK